MNRYEELWKEVGETPLQALTRFREEHPTYRGVSACYAGRLDPMAEGKLLVLFGEECKRQEQYCDFDKEYEIEVLLDVGSDTGDALGIVSTQGSETEVSATTLSKILAAECGRHTRAYPVFSSKTVKGKPLFLYALEGKLGEITVPEHEEEIYAITHTASWQLTREALEARVDAFLSKTPKTTEPSKQLGADFRIEAVRKSWKKVFEETPQRRFTLLALTVRCSSGTYMRALAPRIGTALGTLALALSIRRTRLAPHLL